MLCVDGEDVIVDSGTYTYSDRFWRNFFRSVAAHNTITIDKLEQHTPHTKTVFNLTHITKGNPEKVSNDATVIEGSYSLNHDRNTYIIRRKYTYTPSSKKILTIHDHIESLQRASHSCTVYIYLNLSPTMTPVAIVGGKEKDTIPEVTIAKKNDHTHHVYTIKGDTRLSVHVSESRYAPAYGLKNPTQRVVFSCEEKPPIDCKIDLLQPEANDDQ